MRIYYKTTDGFESSTCWQLAACAIVWQLLSLSESHTFRRLPSLIIIKAKPAATVSPPPLKPPVRRRPESLRRRVPPHDDHGLLLLLR
jgi:hypothetical protein